MSGPARGMNPLAPAMVFVHGGVSALITAQIVDDHGGH